MRELSSDSSNVVLAPGIKLDAVDDTFSEILLRVTSLISACAFTPRNVTIIAVIKILLIFLIFILYFLIEYFNLFN